MPRSTLKAFGCEQTLMTYEATGEAHFAHYPDQIMWEQLVSQEGVRIMASDVRSGWTAASGLTLSTCCSVEQMGTR